MCSTSEVVGRDQRRTGDSNTTPEQQGRPRSPATQYRHANGPTNTPEHLRAQNGVVLPNEVSMSTARTPLVEEEDIRPNIDEMSGAGDSNITPEQQGRPRSPATQYRVLLLRIVGLQLLHGQR